MYYTLFILNSYERMLIPMAAEPIRRISLQWLEQRLMLNGLDQDSQRPAEYKE